jgi:hypothetical protein
MCITIWKKPIWKGYISMNSILWLSGKVKIWKQVVARCWEEGRMNRLGAEDFLGQWNYSVCSYNGGYISLHICQTAACTTPRVNLNVNYRLWVKMRHCYMFISCHKCTTLMGNVNRRKGYHVWGQGTYENSVYSSPFCCESKILHLKNKQLD